MFILLGGLGEGVEFSFVHPAGDEKFTGSFGCALKQNRCLDFKKVLLVKKFPNCHRCTVAKLECVQVALSAKVEIAIGKPEVFAHLIGRVVHGEGRRFRLVMDNDGTGKELDISGGQVAVLRTFVAVADFSLYLNHTFGFELGEEFGKGLVFGVEYDLGLSFPIAEVEKEDASVVA